MRDVATVVSALAPAFAAGFALQRAIEIADSWIPTYGIWAEKKRKFLAVVSFFVGLGIVQSGSLFHVLQQIVDPTRATIVNSALDWVVSALIISAGTDGFNSILKFLEYKKDDIKADVPVTGNPAATAATFKKATELVNATPLPAPQV